MTELSKLLATYWNSDATDPLFDLGPVPEPFLEALPSDYLNTVRELGGREGYIGTQYLRLHRLEELAALNFAYDVPSAVPEIVIFGSDGALEAFAFTLHEQFIVNVPFIPLLAENAHFLSRSFSDFIATIQNTGPSLATDPNTLGMQIHNKHPIALGGSPTDPDNHVLVPPKKHAEIARYWNQVYNQVRSQTDMDA